MRSRLSSIFIFIMLSIGLVAVAGLLLLFSYLFIWALFIGCIMGVCVYLKQYFFPSRGNKIKTQASKGRIIEHKDVP